MKNILYRLFDKIGSRMMNFIFIIAFIILILFISMGTILPELNRQTYEGTIVQKYKENHLLTTGKTQFVELKSGNDTIKIENSDILLRNKFDSHHLQKEIKEGQKARIYTIGFNIPSIGLYPNLYKIEQ
ncbi:hypothetical protein [Staphylococcus felis]|nr:hypothetical protein [Staphylococcus felis]